MNDMVISRGLRQVLETKNGILAPEIALTSVGIAANDDGEGLYVSFELYDRRTAITYKKLSTGLKDGKWGSIDWGLMDGLVHFEPESETSFNDEVFRLLRISVAVTYCQCQYDEVLLKDLEKLVRETWK